MSYSLENARRFGWSSITGKLPKDRLAYLESHIVGQKILDAGCAGGAYVDFLSRQNLKVTGLERFQEFLEVRNKEGTGVYVQGDITKLPFKDKAFDFTYCFDVLEHVDDYCAISELARVTTKRIIIIVPKEDDVLAPYMLTFHPYRDPTHLRYYTEDTLNRLASSVGGREVEIFPISFVNTEQFVLNMVDFSNTGSIIPLRGPLQILKRPNSRLKQLLMRLSAATLKRILSVNASYKKIPFELAAVIDL